MEKESQKFTFEKAYARLEAILEKLNSGEIPLEESLTLYEEADRLIANCSNLLNSAEQKIQTLIKNRSGELALDENSQPLLDEFQPPNDQVITRNINTQTS